MEDKYHMSITYMWNLKKDTNELIYKTEIDSKTENKLMITKGEVGGGINYKFEIGKVKLTCIKKKTMSYYIAQGTIFMII